jgi:hypothetical protein
MAQDMMNMAAANAEISHLQQQVAQLEHVCVQLTGRISDPVRHLKVPKPPETNGRQPSPVNWCHKMETYLNSEGADCSRPGIVPFAAAYLKDSALCWYRAHLQEVQLQHKAEFANWAEFKQAFIARFTPIDPEVDARERLARITQSKSMFAYAADFNAVMLELPHMDENDRIWRFVNGLRPQVRMQVKLHNPRTLHEAVEIAIKADAVVWEPRRPTAGKFGADSYKSAGHFSNFSRSSARPVPMELGLVRQASVRQDGPAQKSGSVCFYCGKEGHFKAQCPKRKAKMARYALGTAHPNGGRRAVA